MALFALDADTCIHVLRREHPWLRDRLVQEAGDVVVSSIVLTELLVGIEKSAHQPLRKKELARFLAPLELVDFDEVAAEHAANIRADLERRGLKIGGIDFLIAGHARSLGAVLVTGNLREFSRVDGLRCEDWSSPSQERPE